MTATVVIVTVVSIHRMSKARDLINAHLYPVLATFAVIYGAIQIAPIAQQARDTNACVQYGLKKNPDAPKAKRAEIHAITVSYCNGAGLRGWIK